MIKNKEILNNINALLLFFCLVFPCIVLAERGDISLSNGGQLNQGTNYQNITSINNGLTLSLAIKRTPNYNISAGGVTSYWINNNAIYYENMTLNNKLVVSVSTVPTTTVNIGITFNTTASGDTIREIAYVVNNNSPITVYRSFDPRVAPNATVQVSTMTDQLVKGIINSIKWYAQTNVAPTESFWTPDFKVYIDDSPDYIKILQPGQIATPKPRIQVEIFSAFGFNESSVTVKLFSGSSTNTACIYNATGAGHFKYENDKKFLEYTYDGPTLTDKGQYTLSVQFTDNKNNTIGPQLVTFNVDNNPVAQLLPYPSPYTPNSGKPMKIKYVLAEATSVAINIYDRAGKFISKVIDKLPGAEGANYTEWKAKSYAGDSLANGIYICEIITDNAKENRRYRSFAILRK